MTIFGDLLYPDNPKRRAQVSLLTSELTLLSASIPKAHDNAEAGRANYLALLVNNAAMMLRPRQDTLTGEDLKALTTHLDFSTPVEQSVLSLQFPDLDVMAKSSPLWTAANQWVAATAFDAIKPFLAGSWDRATLEGEIANMTPKVESARAVSAALAKFNHALTIAIADEIKRFAVLDACYTLLDPKPGPRNRFVFMERDPYSVTAYQTMVRNRFAADIRTLTHLRNYMDNKGKSTADLKSMTAIERRILGVSDDTKFKTYLQLIDALAQAEPTPVRSVAHSTMPHMYFHNEGFAPAALLELEPDGTVQSHGGINPGQSSTEFILCAGLCWRLVYQDTGFEGFYTVGFSEREEVHLSWNIGVVAQHHKWIGS